MYLVGLPRIAQDLGASEAQLHIAFSVYLAGMASAMLFAGRIADRSGRKPVAIVGAAIFVIASCSAPRRIPAATSSSDALSGIGAGSCYVVAFAILRDTLDDRRRAKVLSLLNGITCIIPVLGAGAWPPDYAEISVAEPVLHDDRHGRHGRCAVGLYPA